MTPAPHRHGAFIGLCLLVACLGVAAQPRLPAVNLLLSWEVVDAPRPALPSGGVVVSTQGLHSAQPGVVLRSAPAAAPQAGVVRGVQRLHVANGAQASVRFGEPVMLQWAEGWRDAATTAGGTAQDHGVLRRAWAEAVTALAVQPAWPGGAAPVHLSVSAVLPQGPAAGAMAPMARLGGVATADAPPAHAQWSTQLQVPLGEWVTVGGLAPAAAPSPGELSTRAVAPRAGPLLRLKVERAP